MNFDKPSYEVREDNDVVMIMIALNQPSSKPFDVMISVRDGIAEGKHFYVMCNIKLTTKCN